MHHIGRHVGTWVLLGAGLGLVCPCAPDAPVAPPPLMEIHASRELRPGMTDEDKAVALAAWIARNATNDHRRKRPSGVPFHGLCGYRSTVYERLGARAGLVVQRVVIDDFAGSGHTAVEVRWDDAWHYLDVTYAGYFRLAGRILSFDEIQAEPEAALAGMVVLDGSLDRWEDGTPVDNADRMRLKYTPESLRTATRRGSPREAAGDPLAYAPPTTDPCTSSACCERSFRRQLAGGS